MAKSNDIYSKYFGENWNQPVIENSRVVNIDSRIVDKYGFYWGNKYYNEYDNNGKIEKVKLEAIYKKEFPNIVEDLTEFAYTTNKHIGIRPLIILLIIS